MKTTVLTHVKLSAAIVASTLITSGCTIVEKVHTQNTIQVKETMVMGLQRQPIRCQPLVIEPYQRPLLSLQGGSLSWRDTLLKLTDHIAQLNRTHAQWQQSVIEAIDAHNRECGLVGK